jgi:hypothetical protein
MYLAEVARRGDTPFKTWGHTFLPKVCPPLTMTAPLLATCPHYIFLTNQFL